MAGGKHMRQQLDMLAKGVQLVVGTPGRVLDHIGRRTMRLDDLWCVVLDEADRMLDIGFRPAIERIMRSCPTDRQTMLLSATMPPAIEKLSEKYLQDPVRINCSQSQVSGETIEQRYFTVRQDDKFQLLIGLLKARDTTSSHYLLPYEARHRSLASRYSNGESAHCRTEEHAHGLHPWRYESTRSRITCSMLCALAN